MSETKPMSATHTPTPWRVSGFEQRSGGAGRVIMGDDSFSVAHVMDRTPAENEVDATFIVEAVNSHEALKEQVAWWEEQGRQYVTRIQELESELASCRECRAKIDCLSRSQPKDTAK